MIKQHGMLPILQAISSALTTFTTCALSIVVVAIVTPAALLALLPLSIIYYRVQQVGARASVTCTCMYSLLFAHCGV